MADTTIRRYQNSDRFTLFTLSADTVFFGEPVEAFLEDRSLYCDAFTRYYVDFEIPFIWVADNPDGVIGFLLGCADTSSYLRQWRKYIINRVLLKTLLGRYTIGHRTASFAWGMLVGMLRGEEAKVNPKVYPAHLQIGVNRDYRGVGVGKGLINAYLEQLRGLGVCGVHLETTSHNEAACYLYEKMGFQLLDNYPNQYWTRLLGFPVKSLNYGLIL